ncbi:hypothetical protein [Chitinolyticbacter albus]|uniref:hypothetical protein n=1 Tax=Chitinolyticbacter albus TaxID=2961951 RepID=UPI00210D2A72|nr:hypothetical protein [Chitinolyticbacter albus]
MSPFSIRIREEVLATFPEWSAFAVEQAFKGSGPYLVVTVPAPPEAKSDHPLRISTWDDEVTVEFDYYHTHFDRWNPVEGDNRHTSALFYVKSVLDEKVAVASWWQEEACKVCSQLEPGESLKPPLDVVYSRVRVRSWRGSHNADSDA